MQHHTTALKKRLKLPKQQLAQHAFRNPLLQEEAIVKIVDIGSIVPLKKLPLPSAGSFPQWRIQVVYPNCLDNPLAVKLPTFGGGLKLPVPIIADEVLRKRIKVLIRFKQPIIEVLALILLALITARK
jgi:hypothetical protein